LPEGASTGSHGTDSHVRPEAAYRALVRADSGFGKTTLLWDCQRQIAAEVPADGAVPMRVPIRIGIADLEGLTSVDAIIQRFANRLPWIDAWKKRNLTNPQAVSEERTEWLTRKLHHGEIVLLLDAIDQTKTTLDELKVVLSEEPFRSTPVIATGRWHVRVTSQLTQSDETTWKDFRVDGFDVPTGDRYRDWVLRPGLEEFLGPAATILLPHGQDDDTAKAKKRLWADLLRAPLLAKLLREMARKSANLRDLINREEVYWRAIEEQDGLLDRGMDAVRKRWPQQKILLGGKPNVVRQYGKTAWRCFQSDDFQGTLEADDWSDLFDKHRDEPYEALEMIDLFTLHNVLERTNDTRLAWRHLSFAEYFAASHLCGMSDSEWTEIARTQARDPQWSWVFRFALSRLQRIHKGGESREARVSRLARYLIEFGNPFLVYTSITEDRVQLPPELENLCRWLVHRDRDTSKAWNVGDERPRLSSETVKMLETAMQREWRDSRYLYAAWELLEQSSGDSRDTDSIRQAADRIRAGFLAEFPKLRSEKDRVATGLWNSFVRCPPVAKRVAEDEDHRPFVQGDSGKNRDDDEAPHRVIVSPFHIMDFVVTNEQFELMAPRHNRTQWNVDPDQPVTEVTWFEAQMFAVFVGAQLVTEAQWEYAARAGATSQYCRIADPTSRLGYRDLDDERKLELVANFNSKIGATTKRGQHRPNWWGLYDMLGNVWEWVADWYGDTYYDELKDTVAVDPPGPVEGSSRVIRGGSWNYVAANCRAALRAWDDPSYRGNNLGFRLALSFVGVPAESGQDKKK
jgi:formylglycine-generating enzyme required for sulfatase activity